MIINTKLFGTIDIEEERVIVFVNGIIGFPELQRFILVRDAENETSNISWMQSVDEPGFAMPVIDPLILMEDYDPLVEDEMLKTLGTLNVGEMLVLVTLTIPSDITKMTANLKAPIIVNTGNNKASQLIVDDEKYEVKHPVYDLLKSKKKEA